MRRLSTTDVYRADEFFCTGTMGELAGVVRLDGRVIGDGRVGPVTQRLSARCAEEVRRRGYAIVAREEGQGKGRDHTV